MIIMKSARRSLATSLVIGAIVAMMLVTALPTASTAASFYRDPYPVEHKGRVTHAGRGRIVIENPGVLSRRIDPNSKDAFEVFLVDESTQILNPRGDAISLNDIDDLTWACVTTSSDQEDDPWPTALTIRLSDDQTRQEAQTPADME